MSYQITSGTDGHSIINQLGYTANNANLISVPIYVCDTYHRWQNADDKQVFACIVTVCVGFAADRYPQRSLFTLSVSVTHVHGSRLTLPLRGFTTLGIIGYAILIGNDPRDKPGVSYFAIYLAAMGIYPLISNVIALTAGNVSFFEAIPADNLV